MQATGAVWPWYSTLSASSVVTIDQGKTSIILCFSSWALLSVHSSEKAWWQRVRCGERQNALRAPGKPCTTKDIFQWSYFPPRLILCFSTSGSSELINNVAFNFTICTQSYVTLDVSVWFLLIRGMLGLPLSLKNGFEIYIMFNCLLHHSPSIVW